MSNDDWCTIESDPGVFTSLIESFGTRNAEFAELWSLDDDALSSLTSPIDGVDDAAVHGLIFLFKWQSSSSSNIGRGGEQDEGAAAIGGIGGRGEPLTGDDVPPGLFFARQVTHNACATQAILSVLFNAPNSIVERGDGDDDDDDDDGGRRDDVDDMNGRRLVLGGTLSDFRSFTSHFPPDLRGEAIGSSEAIRAAHNSFGRAEDAFLGGDPGRPKRAATDDDDVFHFVAYVPHAADGCVYELDGLQPGPIRVGSYEAGEDDAGGGASPNGAAGWIRAARDAIQSRLSAYPPGEIKFNLMALVQDRRTYLCERLDSLAAVGVEESDPAMLGVRSDLHAEEEKRERWKAENERRRHNYLPFSVEFLRCLAGSGKFEKLIDMARKNAGEKRKRADAWKKTRGGG